MFILEWLLPLIVALTVGYSGVAYKHGLPLPGPSRHDRALARIAKLEIDLGFRESDIARSRRENLERVQRSIERERREALTVHAAYPSASRGEVVRPDIAKLKAEGRWNENQQNPA